MISLIITFPQVIKNMESLFPDACCYFGLKETVGRRERYCSCWHVIAFLQFDWLNWASHNQPTTNQDEDIQRQSQITGRLVFEIGCVRGTERLHNNTTTWSYFASCLTFRTIINKYYLCASSGEQVRCGFFLQTAMNLLLNAIKTSLNHELLQSGNYFMFSLDFHTALFNRHN